MASSSNTSSTDDCSLLTPDTQVDYWKAGVVIALVLAYRINTLYALTPLGKKVFPLMCSVLLIVLQVASPIECYCAIHENFSTLLTLIGMMIFAAVLEKNDVMPVLRTLITGGPSWMKKSRQIFFLRVSFCTVIISALITNDCCCLLMVPLVVEGMKELKFKDEACVKVTLLAVTMSSNIGATLLPMGSPQTLIIFATNGLTFSDFIIYMSGPVAAAFIMNYAGLIIYYYCYSKCTASRQQKKSLLDTDLLLDENEEIDRRDHERQTTGAEELANVSSDSQIKQRVKVPHFLELKSSISTRKKTKLFPKRHLSWGKNAYKDMKQEEDSRKCKNVKITILLILLVLFPVYLIIGDRYPDLPGVGEIGWTSMLLGSLGLLVHWSYADHLINREVDWGIIIFFIGAFALMSTLVNRGVARIPVEIFFTPKSQWTFLHTSTDITTTQSMNLTTSLYTTTSVTNIVPGVWHSLQNSMQVAASTLILSNVIGNVPLVLVVLGVLKWNKMLLLLLSYVAALAGNLTFIGAATHIIVSEHETKLITPKDITSYGIISTLPNIVVGVVMIWGMMKCNDPFSDHC